jgi:hypothetical protein
MPIILKHPNSNANYGAPKDWNEELNGPCATLPAIHFKNCNVIHLGFTADEIAILAAGGSFQLAIWQDTMPVLTPSVEEWPNQRYDDDGHVISVDDSDISPFVRYRRTQIAEMTPWHEAFDVSGVSISIPDAQNGSPQTGDMIARNPANHDDKWLVSAEYFAANFEPLR